MPFDLKEINAIIFDLGNVLINIDTQATIEAFAQLSGRPIDELRDLFQKGEYFKKYEIGAITNQEFRNFVKSDLGVAVSNEQIDQAWNATLCEFKMERIEALRVLQDQLPLFVMSNTNGIHVREFLKKFDALNTGKPFHNYFKKVYFSHEIHIRKPNPEAWTIILKENNLSASNTLFVDDLPENIAAASALGIKTFHNQHCDDWLSLIKV